MDKTCNDLNAALDESPLSMVTDVWEAQFLGTFDGPQQGIHFDD